MQTRPPHTEAFEAQLFEKRSIEIRRLETRFIDIRPTLPRPPEARSLRPERIHTPGRPAAQPLPLLLLQLLAALLASCSGGSESSTDIPKEDSFAGEEARYDAIYAATLIGVTGAVVGESGEELSGVVVSVVGLGTSAADVGTDAGEADLGSGAAAVDAGSATVGPGSQGLTDLEGVFSLEGLRRRSALLKFHLDGYYDEIVPVDLQRPLGDPVNDLGIVRLTKKKLGWARLHVAGDTMLGRRFSDRDEDGVEGEAGDLIRPQSRTEDAQAVLRFVRHTLSAADYAVVNLETAVTDDPETPHPYKDYTIWSHPEAIQALTDAGVDAVSLGNNHVYDYLEHGMRDTMDFVSWAGLESFGAGMSASEAAGSLLARRVNDIDLAFQGFDGIVPSSTWGDPFLYVARDSPRKGGALELTDGNLDSYLQEALGLGRFAIPSLHGGAELSEYPDVRLRKRLIRALQGGAGFVVAHHPGTVQGIAQLKGYPGTGFALLSLGSLLSDEETSEALRSYVGVVDVERLGSGSVVVRRIQLVPVHLEGYVPKPVLGEWAASIARQVGHLSTRLPASAESGDPPDNLVGAVVFPAGARGYVALDPSQYEASDVQPPSLTVSLSRGSSAPLPFPRTDAAEFLVGVGTSEPASCRWGRDILHYGDLEDLDVDDESGEGRLWETSASCLVENSVVRSGSAAMVVLRKATDTAYVSTWTRSRVGFLEGVDLTLTGYVKGQNAGEVEVLVRWYERERGTTLSTPIIQRRAAGTYDWERFTVDLDPPAGAGRIRVYLRQRPPEASEGKAFFDDLSLIQWEDGVEDASLGVEIPGPNDWSWLQFRAENPDASSLDATLTHRVYSPRWNAVWEGNPQEGSFLALEEAFDAMYAATPIEAKGRVVSEVGEPQAGVKVTAIGWGEASENTGAEAVTGPDGAFALQDLGRRSVLLMLERDGYYDEVLPVDLQRPLGEVSSDLGSITLVERRAGRARILVGGDVMLPGDT